MHWYLNIDYIKNITTIRTTLAYMVYCITCQIIERNIELFFPTYTKPCHNKRNSLCATEIEGEKHAALEKDNDSFDGFRRRYSRRGISFSSARCRWQYRTHNLSDVATRQGS